MSIRRWCLTFALISAALFAAMHLISIPVIGQGMGTDHMFDILPLGYDFAYAQKFLANLSPQALIDTAFPISLGLTCILIAKWLAKTWTGFIMASLLAVAYVLCDLYENSLVAHMLSTNDLTIALVTRASQSTVFKFALLAATAFSLLALTTKRYATQTQSPRMP